MALLRRGAEIRNLLSLSAKWRGKGRSGLFIIIAVVNVESCLAEVKQRE